MNIHNIDPSLGKLFMCVVRIVRVVCRTDLGKVLSVLLLSLCIYSSKKSLILQRSLCRIRRYSVVLCTPTIDRTGYSILKTHVAVSHVKLQ